MKKKYLISVIVIISVIIAFSIATEASKGVNVNYQKQKNVDAKNETNLSKQTDTSKIVFKIPSVNCGNIHWNDRIITDWLANYCLDKCNDSVSTGYKFSGWIKNSQKNYSLKVAIKTDRDYLQPVKFYPENGSFEGKVYFDKTNRSETLIKITLRDSNRVALETFVITLLE